MDWIRKLKPMAVPAVEATLQVAAVYQDAHGRKRATALCRRVSQMMGDDAIVSHLWSYAELRRPDIFSQAVAAAVLADVLVVSARAGEPCPEILGAWVEAWSARRQRQDGALIALMSVSAGQSAAEWKKMEAYLRSVARRSQLDFLWREQATTGSDPSTPSSYSPSR